MKYNIILYLIDGLCITAVTQAATPSYRTAVLVDNPLIYYQFDETSGTTAVNSGSTGTTNDGTIGTEGGEVTINQPSFPSGGSSYDFDGGHVLAAALPSSLTEWSIEAWVNWDPAKTSASNIFGNDQGGWNNDVLFGIGAENGSFGVPESSIGLIQQGSPGDTRDFVESPMTDSEWHHVVVTASTTNSELILYVDGVEVAKEVNFNNGLTMNGDKDGDPDTIGSPFISVGGARAVVDPGYRPFDGLIDEFAIYETVLGADAIQLHYTVGVSDPPSSITDIDYDSNTDTVSLTWTSRANRLYDLLSATDLSTPPASWDVYEGQEDIAGSDNGTTTLTGALISGTPRFFVVSEKDFPPSLQADFEGGADGWTIETNGIVSDTTWEVGPPVAGPPGAHSGANVFGTDLDADFEAGIANPDTNLGIGLRSPVVDLAELSSATLTFWHFLEASEQSGGRLNLLRGDDGSPIQGFTPTLFLGDKNTDDWTEFTLRLPQEALDAGSIIIEFEFLSSDSAGAGWFIDDVEIRR